MTVQVDALAPLSGPLAKVGQSNQKIHFYRTADVVAVVEAANYFDSAAKQLNQGDFIFASMVTGGAAIGMVYHVTSITASVVVVAPIAAL